MRIASSAASTPTSDANSLAMPACIATLSPLSASDAAHQTSRRAAWIFGGHVGELDLDRLEVADRLTERVTLARVLQRLVVGALRVAERAGRDVDAAGLERAEHLLQALALDAADEVLDRDAHVDERDLAGLGALVAELREVLADR